ncbi:hypothetical protein KAS08_05235 [Candidatus Pacearchaeota archaeon]|nr:hypothetical protein [Candidatus Pacearchaeota archaeon]
MVKQINITLSNKLFYVIIFLGIFVLIAGVYAYTTDGSGNPEVMGHSVDEMKVPAYCLEGEVLRVVKDEFGNSGWDCDANPVIDVGEVNAYRIYADMICIGDPNNCRTSWPVGTEDWLVGLEHTKEECDSANGGELYSDDELGEYYICKFDGAVCPTGWKQYDKWTKTIPNTVSVSGWTIICNDCITGSHSFANKAIETCDYRTAVWFTSCRDGDWSTLRATVTEVGCY